MADIDKTKGGKDENSKPNTVPDGISSLSDEEAITEIDIGNFLNEKDNDAVLYEGYHEDIKKTEQSLEDEIQSLMDNIMSTGPVTIVPKPIDKIIAEPKKSDDAMSELWMNPDEYIDIPKVKTEQTVKASKPVEPVPDTAKDDIFSMIDTLKADTDNDKAFDNILSDIESNKNIAPVDIEHNAAEKLAGEKPAAKAPAAHIPEATHKAKPKAKDEIDINAEGFDDELAALLGDKDEETQPKGSVPSAEPKKQAEPKADAPQPVPDIYIPKRKDSFKVVIPEDTLPNFTEPTVEVSDLLPKSNEKTVGNVPVEIIEDDGKISRQERKQAKVDAKIADGKNPKTAEIIRKIVLIISVIVIIISGGILLKTYFYEPYMFKQHQSEVQNIVSVPKDESDVSETVASDDTEYPVGMLAKYKKLYALNSDLRGWISIPGLEINLPLAQGSDNDYYLHRNIYKQRTNYGVPFFDYRIEDFKNLPLNTVIYGHNMHYDDLIFGMLENYREISGFKQAPVIECNTIYNDYQWFVYGAFITNSKASQDNGYMFSYNFLDISSEKFTEYIKEIDKRKFYTTGVDIQPTDKILTLSTCCYDFDGARLVVVARLKRDGESSSPDVSQAVTNDNPKYPQAWYDANKKQNPYADDSRWSPYN